MQEMIMKSAENIEKIKTLQRQNDMFTNTNEDLKSSLHSLNVKLERRDQDVYDLTDKLEELENELERVKHENVKLKRE
jgi:predicted nuclease with TOPRIM domain